MGRQMIEARLRRERWEAGSQLFARMNGFIGDVSEFTVEALQKGAPHGGKRRFFDERRGGYDIFDHAEFYKLPGQPARAVCVVAHVYGDPKVVREQAQAWAKTNGLVAHFQDGDVESWHSPGYPITVVAYTRPGIVIQWPGGKWRELISPEAAALQ